MQDGVRTGGRKAIAAVLGVVLLVAAVLWLSGDSGEDAPSSPSPVATAPTPAPAPVADGGRSSASAAAPAVARTDYPVPSFAALAARFTYDRDAPLDFQILREQRDLHTTVFDVSYAGASHTVRAWLVLPAVRRPAPAVLFVHPYAGSREWFLCEAQTVLGPSGVAGLLVDTRQNLWSSDAEQNGRAWRSLLTDLRRGLDLLETLPQVDPRRLGFVGSGQGADAGAILAGLDHRVRTYALITSATYLNRVSQFDDAGMARLQGGTRERFLGSMFAYSPALYIRHNVGATFLLMNPRTDRAHPIRYARALRAVTPGPKRLWWHRAGPESDAGYEFQSNWVLRHL